ncbi:alpha/beta hydrolase [Algoriphagus confluentis]|uniref:Alpha/beta hydrolase n=1 Tax=Algoriphagus confluentis TaxID=1697556 RepID=A0ABQ6PUW7_9BACT|nr:alpha/beta hydrolase [Algoriphagus confluentis]
MRAKGSIILLLIICLNQFSHAQNSFQVIVKGKGSPVLLFPGIGCSGEVWNETVEELSKTHECHVFTFAGFGGVPAIEGAWLSTIKKDIVGYVKEKQLNKPALLGHSLGGTLSLWLASTDGNLFSQAIIVDALPSMAALMIPGYQGKLIEYENPQNKMMLTMDAAAFSAMNSKTVEFMCLTPQKHSQILSWLNKADRKTYVYGYVDLLNLDLRESIAQITIPVSILAATYPDRQTVEKNYRIQYQQIPTADLQFAENSAHFIMYDQPEWFIDQLITRLR